ncbi:MAG: EamA family transporter [Alphaproteobacteria bacterium]
MIWFVYACCAALLWGVSYTVSEQLMKKISIPGVLLTAALGNLLFAVVAGLVRGDFEKDIAALKNGDGAMKLMLGSVAVYVGANIFILLATKSKNATMAAMVEITYPLWTALFAWVLFKETQMNMGTAFGAALILSGVCCIYYFSKTV